MKKHFLLPLFCLNCGSVQMQLWLSHCISHSSVVHTSFTPLCIHEGCRWNGTSPFLIDPFVYDGASSNSALTWVKGRPPIGGELSVACTHMHVSVVCPSAMATNARVLKDFCCFGFFFFFWVELLDVNNIYLDNICLCEIFVSIGDRIPSGSPNNIKFLYNSWDKRNGTLFVF